jgi:glycosyltransferase involved in cell wall biosynthesis
LQHYGVPEDRLFFVPHCVDNVFFAERAQEAEDSGKTREIRNKYGIPQDAFLLLFVGKLTAIKRPADFIEACMKVMNEEEGADVHALIVGDGPLRGSLETLASSRMDRIHFAGFRNQSEMPTFYRASNTLVLPSEGESWGLAVNEAFACGIPAVVSDAVGCTPDMIEGGRTGYAFSVGDIIALVEQMRMLRHLLRQAPDRMGNPVATKSAAYSMERATEGLEAALEQVVAGHRGQGAVRLVRQSAGHAEREVELRRPRKMAVVRSDTPVESLRHILVLGMGAEAFGREKRAVTMLENIKSASLYFLISKWENGTVSSLLRSAGLEYGYAPFGYLGRAHPVWTLVALAHLPSTLVKVVRAYLMKRCDMILMLCIHPFVNAFPAVMLLRYLAGARLIFYMGDTPLNSRPYRLIGRLIDRLAHRVIVNSHAVGRGMEAIGVRPEKMVVIYNGKDLKQFDCAVPIDFRQRFNWPVDAPLVGFAGQFRPNKGVWNFIGAAEVVLSEYDRARFLLIGRHDLADPFQGEIAQYLHERKLSDRIVFTGWIEHIERAFRALDVAVVPSRHEDPAPNVCIEAMTAGVPVVATRVGGSPELVVDGETGFLVEKENPGQIAECILRLADDKGLREKMGRAGRDRARDLFDVRKNALQVEEVLLGA